MSQEGKICIYHIPYRESNVFGWNPPGMELSPYKALFEGDFQEEWAG